MQAAVYFGGIKAPGPLWNIGSITIFATQTGAMPLGRLHHRERRPWLSRINQTSQESFSEQFGL